MPVLCFSLNCSAQIELDSTLAQAEVLFLSFRNLVEELDKEIAEADAAETSGLRKRTNATGEGNSTSAQGEEDKERMENAERDKKILTPQLRELLERWSSGQVAQLLN